MLVRPMVQCKDVCLPGVVADDIRGATTVLRDPVAAVREGAIGAASTGIGVPDDSAGFAGIG